MQVSHVIVVKFFTCTGESDFYKEWFWLDLSHFWSWRQHAGNSELWLIKISLKYGYLKHKNAWLQLKMDFVLNYYMKIVI